MLRKIVVNLASPGSRLHRATLGPAVQQFLLRAYVFGVKRSVWTRGVSISGHRASARTSPLGRVGLEWAAQPLYGQAALTLHTYNSQGLHPAECSMTPCCYSTHRQTDRELLKHGRVHSATASERLMTRWRGQAREIKKLWFSNSTTVQISAPD